MVKEVDESLGCLIWVIAIAVATYLYYHGNEVVEALSRFWAQVGA